ncbi:hypothetical protein [Herpetosiphon geysericola]|uniref:50S ribosomal protein L7/L12 n=1 Tax=Herpetosiphon geysericola TaxID=70996 RepID=A0A0N8GT12_9CHLR|nr:hypothetical protein [Herpetosiphon geysericola]KPL90810.1 hypothetical protein SE18_04830 [Herpetosiphon geysericola]
MSLVAILEQVQTLSVQERKDLVKFLVDSLDVPPRQPLLRLADMAGFAAVLATDDDAQAYVDGLRDAWERPQ